MLKSLLTTPAFLLGMGLFLLTIALAVVPPLFMKLDYVNRVGPPFQPPSSAFILGTDQMGMDMFAIVIKGLQSSLYAGFLAGIIATCLGTFIGVYGGYKGGLIDDLLTSATNIFLVIPNLIVLILLSSSIKEGRSLTLIAAIIGLTTWTWTARAVRAQSASLRARDHVNLARINGFGTITIVLKHILPYLLSYVFMVFILQTASGILAEASISMLGLGPYDAVSLGKILYESKKSEALIDGAWWIFVPAMVLITVMVFALYVINTSMESVFNPRLRK